MSEGPQFLDRDTMRGCRMRLHDFQDGAIPCARLSLDVDGRHAEVLLDGGDVGALLDALAAWMDS